ncbi:MAG: glycosyltransferase [Clostridium sp.]|nr:glycosyltransferase [Clostridium sp.]
MDLSIIIPVYNAAALIDRCLNSIFSQTTQYTYEVICVDDGSTDSSVELIEARKEPNIRLFKQQNAGPAKARNKGLAEASGRYICYIDADDYWEDTFFEKTISFLEEHKECIAVSVGQRHLTVSGNHTAPVCLDKYNEPVVLDDFFSFWAQWMHVCTGSIVIRSECARKTGGQRTELRITEDLEYWALLATQGKFGMIPEILFTSDGTDLIKGNGWLKKMEIRWRNAPSIAEWEKRIIAIKPELEKNEGYRRARGRISRNLTYCQLLSDRISLSRREALRYGKYFLKDPIGRLMNVAKYTSVTWWMLAKFLKYREYHRKGL